MERGGASWSSQARVTRQPFGYGCIHAMLHDPSRNLVVGGMVDDFDDVPAARHGLWSGSYWEPQASSMTDLQRHGVRRLSCASRYPVTEDEHVLFVLNSYSICNLKD